MSTWVENWIGALETYLGHYQTSMNIFLCENSRWLNADYYFCKKNPLYSCLTHFSPVSHFYRNV